MVTREEFEKMWNGHSGKFMYIVIDIGWICADSYQIEEEVVELNYKGEKIAVIDLDAISRVF